MKCFDIFKHLRGSGTVDKIKKYRRDSPLGVFTDLGRRDSPKPQSVKTPSEIPLGIPYYNTSQLLGVLFIVNPHIYSAKFVTMAFFCRFTLIFQMFLA